MPWLLLRVLLASAGGRADHRHPLRLDSLQHVSRWRPSPGTAWLGMGPCCLSPVDPACAPTTCKMWL